MLSHLSINLYEENLLSLSVLFLAACGGGDSEKSILHLLKAVQVLAKAHGKRSSSNLLSED